MYVYSKHQSRDNKEYLTSFKKSSTNHKSLTLLVPSMDYVLYCRPDNTTTMEPNEALN